MSTRLVLLELNEVPYRILDEFCAGHPHSTLARLLPRCRQFETYASDAGHLSPWITWPSLHRGVSNHQHGIACFGEDLRQVDAAYPPLWQLLARAGITTGVFGSLHSYGSLTSQDEKRFAFYVPDTFAAGSECFPQQLATFQEFNLSMVQGSSRNVSLQVCWRQALALLAQASELGLKPRTLIDAAGQLFAERRCPARRSRRRTYQSLLAYDVFHRQLTRSRPAFATFFTNHVAAAMHRFWAARFPHDYQSFGLDDRWIATYCDEIDFALRKLDHCLHRLVQFVERSRDYRLWITTSMGQAATTAEPLSTQLYMIDPQRFMSMLGIPPGSWMRRPAMAPDINLVVEPPFIDLFRTQLDLLRIAGHGLQYRSGCDGFFSLRLGQPNLAQRADCIMLRGRVLQPHELGLAHVSIDEQSATTAYHIPQGLLLTFDPRRPPRSVGRTQISTLDIAPALLQHFGVGIPGYMQSSRLGAAA